MADINTSATLKTGLVSYWDLSESSGSRIDSHGSNDLSVWNSMSSYSDGTFGTVADFTGGGLTITDAAQTGLDVTGDLSINLFINQDALGSYFLVSKWTHASANQYITGLFSGSQLDFYDDNTCSGYTNGTFSVSGLSLSINTWYMLTWVRTGTTVELFINAVSQGTGTTLGSQNCNATFALGFEAGRNIYYFNGKMARAGIWSKALSSSEVTELYNSGNGLLYDNPTASVNSNFLTII